MTTEDLHKNAIDLAKANWLDVLEKLEDPKYLNRDTPQFKTDIEYLIKSINRVFDLKELISQLS